MTVSQAEILQLIENVRKAMLDDFEFKLHKEFFYLTRYLRYESRDPCKEVEIAIKVIEKAPINSEIAYMKDELMSVLNTIKENCKKLGKKATRKRKKSKPDHRDTIF